MSQNHERIKVWDLPTRVFHWSLALSFLGAYFTSEGRELRPIHVMFGITVLALIIFRVIWGFAGTRHARFASFVRGPQQVKRYLLSLLAKTPEHHTGHNPAGALAIIGLIGLGLLVPCLGLLKFNHIGPHWLGDVHAVIANIMFALVCVHLAGVVVSSYLHHENLVRAMFSGFKQGASSEGIGGTRRTVGILVLLGVLGFWAGYGWTHPAVLQVFDTSAQTAAHDVKD